jgi:hypothetical protein
MLSFRPIIFLAFAFLSFGVKAQTNSSTDTLFFDPGSFLGDTLYIKTQFMECGEWGGHLELSKIFVKDNQFYINYQKFSADCHSIKENNGRPKQTLVKTLNKKLINKDKQLLRRYFHQLADAKARQISSVMNAGYIFQIKSSNQTINLLVYPGDKKIKDEYLQIIKQIFD